MRNNKASSTNSINKEFLKDCNLTYATLLIGGRWKLPLLVRIEKGARRFSDFKKLLPNITERMLTLQLKEMERDGLITRSVYMEVPLRIEYNLTELGKDLIPICIDLKKWGDKHKLVHGHKQPNNE